MFVCPFTAKPLPDGYFLHPLVADEFVKIGEALASGVVADAEAVRDKLVSPGAGEGGGGIAGPRLLIRANEFYPVEEAKESLRVWVFDILEYLYPGRSMHANVIPWPAVGKMLIANADALCRWQNGPEALDECQDAVNRFMRVLEPRQADKVIECPECGQSSYYSFDLTHLICRHCQAVIEREGQILRMKEEALGMLLPLRQAVDVVRSAGYSLPDGTVKTWIRRGKLVLGPGRTTRPRDIIAVLDKVKPGL